MIHLFGEKEVRDLDILAIQEAYINRHTDQVTTYSQMLGNHFHLMIKPTTICCWSGCSASALCNALKMLDWPVTGLGLYAL